MQACFSQPDNLPKLSHWNTQLDQCHPAHWIHSGLGQLVPCPPFNIIIELIESQHNE